MQKAGTNMPDRIHPHLVFQLQCIVDSLTVSRGWIQLPPARGRGGALQLHQQDQPRFPPSARHQPLPRQGTSRVGSRSSSRLEQTRRKD
ncbi:hypothetical protein QBC34DRAFT_416513 [Podospora aff. communis PSN243]|uniref:Uncharacterized protein n=1 Tax=Podospora aff. communis PSN243 TaxID=3040156 RepID=A0AAV9G7I9_9PEZI|nr:hypothetical protein QBC34DRAFT_416513 [Podospora aff. communis PSN243]